MISKFLPRAVEISEPDVRNFPLQNIHHVQDADSRFFRIAYRFKVIMRVDTEIAHLDKMYAALPDKIYQRFDFRFLVGYTRKNKQVKGYENPGIGSGLD